MSCGRTDAGSSCRSRPRGSTIACCRAVPSDRTCCHGNVRPRRRMSCHPRSSARGPPRRSCGSPPVPLPSPGSQTAGRSCEGCRDRTGPDRDRTATSSGVSCLPGVAGSAAPAKRTTAGDRQTRDDRADPSRTAKPGIALREDRRTPIIARRTAEPGTTKPHVAVAEDRTPAPPKPGSPPGGPSNPGGPNPMSPPGGNPAPSPGGRTPDRRPEDRNPDRHQPPPPGGPNPGPPPGRRRAGRHPGPPRAGTFSLAYFRASTRSSALRIPSLFRSNFSSTSRAAMDHRAAGAARTAKPASERHHFVARQFPVGVLVEFLEGRDSVLDFVCRDFTVRVRIERGEERRGGETETAGSRVLLTVSWRFLCQQRCTGHRRNHHGREGHRSRVDDFAWKRPIEETS